MLRRTSKALLAQPSLKIPCDLKPAQKGREEHLVKRKTAELAVLDNGFRVATKHTGGETSTVGIWIDAGSRYESWATNGVAHFLEHMTFKGTKQRPKAQIENYFEFTGGHLNAFTTREQTVYFCQVFNHEIERSMEIVADMLRYTHFDEWHLKVERHNIMTEKKHVEMSIDEVMMDHVTLTAFPQDGLGMTILGTVDNIQKNIDIPMMQDYVKTHYTARRMVMVGAGGVQHDQLTALSEKLWGDLPAYPLKPENQAQFHGGERIVQFDGILPNLTVVWGICGQSDAEMLVAQVLQMYFGTYLRTAEDADQSSQLSLIAQDGSNGGTLESVQAFTTPYSDTSLFGFYLVSRHGSEGPDALKKFQLDSIRKFLAGMESIDEEKLQRAKETLKINCLLMEDGTSTTVDSLGGLMLAHGRDVPLVELYGRVDALTLQDVRDFVDKYIYEKPYVLCGVGNPDELPPGSNCSDYIWKHAQEYQPNAYGVEIIHLDP